MPDYFTFPWQQLSKYAQQAQQSQQNNSGGYYGYGGSLTKYLPSYQNQVSYSPNYNRNFQQVQQSYNTVPAPAAPNIQPLVQPPTQQKNKIAPGYEKYANIQPPPLPVLPANRRTYYPVSQEANVQPPPLPTIPGGPSQFILDQQQQTYTPPSSFLANSPPLEIMWSEARGLNWSDPETKRKFAEWTVANPSPEQLFSKVIGIPRDIWIRNPEMQKQYSRWQQENYTT